MRNARAVLSPVVLTVAALTLVVAVCCGAVVHVVLARGALAAAAATSAARHGEPDAARRAVISSATSLPAAAGIRLVPITPACRSVVPGVWRSGATRVVPGSIDRDLEAAAGLAGCAWRSDAGPIRTAALPAGTADYLAARGAAHASGPWFARCAAACTVDALTRGVWVQATLPALPPGTRAADVARRLITDYRAGLAAPASSGAAWPAPDCGALDPDAAVPAVLGITGARLQPDAGPFEPEALAPADAAATRVHAARCTWTAPGAPDVRAAIVPGGTATPEGTPVESALLASAGVRDAAWSCASAGCGIDAVARGGTIRITVDVAPSGGVPATEDGLVAAAARLATALAGRSDALGTGR